MIMGLKKGNKKTGPKDSLASCNYLHCVSEGQGDVEKFHFEISLLKNKIILLLIYRLSSGYRPISLVLTLALGVVQLSYSQEVR